MNSPRRPGKNKGTGKGKGKDKLRYGSRLRENIREMRKHAPFKLFGRKGESKLQAVDDLGSDP